VPMFRPTKEMILSFTTGYAIPCEVGDLGEPHGLVAKQISRGTLHDGWPAYTWFSLDSRHAMGQVIVARSPDDIGRFVAERDLAQHIKTGSLRCPLMAEIASAGRDSPGLMTKLLSAGLVRPSADGWPVPPELGRLWRARTKNGRRDDATDISLDVMVPLIERFLNDDLGDYGQLSREPIEDQRTIWSLDLVDRQTRNRDAVTTGSGLIVAKYSIGNGLDFWIFQRLSPRCQAETIVGAWRSGLTMMPLVC
jgi:hypothetical protein